MSHYQQSRNDPTRQTDEYGNPVYQRGGTGMYGTGMGGGATGMGGAGGEAGSYGLGGGQAQQHRKDHHEGGILHRTGSGSSSSSEDDGQGGRRKKGGMKEKLMDKIPGMGGTGQQQQHTAGVGAGYGDQYLTGQQYQTGQQHEKKGMMDKIKEKLPGSH